jgi:hypothetical protein
VKSMLLLNSPTPEATVICRTLSALRMRFANGPDHVHHSHLARVVLEKSLGKAVTGSLLC